MLCTDEGVNLLRILYAHSYNIIAMKTIGILGGMGWSSTRDYYEILNELAHQRFGGSHSCPCIIYSFDFAIIEKLQHEDQWDLLSKLLSEAARSLETAGAELLMIGTNTMHKLALNIKNSIGIPLIHIADAVAQAIKDDGIEKVGLLGTKFTMEQDFYKERLASHAIQTLIPGANERDTIHGILYNELVNGIIQDTSKQIFAQITDGLIRSGAKGIILGCTEIPMLVTQDAFSVPVYNSTLLHARAAFEAATSYSP